MTPTHHFDWSGYLALAQELGDRTEEACLRSSLSRAYYYIYNLAMIRAKDNGFSVHRGEGTHAQLWRLFNTSSERSCVVLAQIALRLKRNRERADYEPVYPRIEEEVPLVLADALDFAARLQRVSDGHPRPSTTRRETEN